MSFLSRAIIKIYNQTLSRHMSSFLQTVFYKVRTKLQSSWHPDTYKKNDYINLIKFKKMK